MKQTRVKICGLREQDDVDQAVLAGADAVGLVFCAKSPRNVSIQQAVALAARVPAFVSLTALFMNPEAQLVEQVLEQVQPELLQFHGQESAEFCSQFGRRYIKAIAMGSDAATTNGPQQQMQAHPKACGFLLDSHALGGMGGSGESFDWQRAREFGQAIIVAGGLHPENVAVAIEQAQAWAVDVSSGVESAPGIKSASKIRRFIENVRAADSAHAEKDA